MKEKTVLQKAKEILTFINYKSEKPSNEDIEAALAWVRDEVRLTSLSKVWGLNNGSSTYNKLVHILKFYIKSNLI